MRITAKHNMTCQQVTRATARGSWHGSLQSSPRYRFATPGFKCRILKVDSGPFVAPGQGFGCHTRSRSFKFGWIT
jgi:hypothetical protein